MTNWNRIKEIERINERELQLNISEAGSWHNTYKNSAYVFAGNLSYDLNEGDIITVFSQFGEVVDCNLIRDKDTGDSKGFAFIAFEDQRSTILAVDNLNGSLLLQRILNVDHVARYRKPKHFNKDNKNKDDNNKYGDIDEDDETYEERRNKIWDYKKYLQLNTDNNYNDNIKKAKKINKKYLKKRKKVEIEYKQNNDQINKQIEMRKLKRSLIRIRMKQNNKNKNKNNYIKQRKDTIVDIEKELNKRKQIEESEKKEEYKKQLQLIKQEKKRKRLAKKSKSQILNKKLKKANKKLKKIKKRKRKHLNNDKDDNMPSFKKRKLHN